MTGMNSHAASMPSPREPGMVARLGGLDLVHELAHALDQVIDFYADPNCGFSSHEERLMLDLKLQYSINRRYDVFLDVTNLTDEPPRTDVALNGLKFFRTNQGVGFVAGVRGRF